ncbi:MAG: formylglycine-generating enzyme family protein [Deltaproteobacteria bacterium]|nr:formylglycine-generating enzyme family protein [Deltaproteobacteria bacterium]
MCELTFETDHESIRINTRQRDEKACVTGRDMYGLYEDIRIKGVAQRFRYVPPGRFLMGSPADEAERRDNETLHEVILTSGYWLADTACTQELWEAVMGENPSRFKEGKGMPVESVSWDMCKEFLEKINGQGPELDLRLPTEAEWEYACRAGTVTPFSFGENITTDDVNYDGNHPYKGGEKGEYREKPVEVKRLPCNNWGLYEMHGNVLEWCEDWYGDYGSEKVVGPTGADNGEFRVLRGGSWVILGGFCRSAFRSRDQPGSRYDYTGFRLARGQKQAGV